MIMTIAGSVDDVVKFWANWGGKQQAKAVANTMEHIPFPHMVGGTVSKGLPEISSNFITHTSSASKFNIPVVATAPKGFTNAPAGTTPLNWAETPNLKVKAPEPAPVVATAPKVETPEPSTPVVAEPEKAKNWFQENPIKTGAIATVGVIGTAGGIGAIAQNTAQPTS